jgi:hypothetical protein
VKPAKEIGIVLLLFDSFITRFASHNFFEKKIMHQLAEGAWQVLTAAGKQVRCRYINFNLKIAVISSFSYYFTAVSDLILCTNLNSISCLISPSTPI